MRFSMKKALASVLCLCLVLSTFVGVLTTSAADATVVGTLTMEDVDVTASADTAFSAVADIALDAEFSFVEVAYLLGTLPEGVSLTSVSVSDGSVYIDAETGAIHASVEGPTLGFAITMNFAVANVAIDPFTLSIASIALADVAEGDITLDISDTATVTIICNHDYAEEITTEATCGADGLKTFTCSICGDSYTEVIPATGEHNYVDGACSMCGQEDPDAVCKHENVEAIRTVTIADGAYNYNTICADCGEIAATEVVANADSAIVANTVAGFASYAAIEMTEAGTATVPFAGTGSVKVAYVDGNKVMASNGLNTANVTAYDPVSVTVSDGIATIDSTRTGIIIVFTLADSTNLDKVLKSHGVGASFVLKSTISMTMKLAVNANYKNVKFDSQYVNVVHHGFNGSTPKDRETVLTEFVDSTSSYDFSYPLAGKELGDSIDVYYYGVKNGVSYLIRVQKDNGMIAYAASKTVFGATGTISEDTKNLQILIANMLKYAGEAQEYFNYNNSADGSTLAYNNPKIASNVAAVLAANPSKVFTTAELNELKAASTTSTPKNSKNQNAIQFGRSLTLEDKIVMNLKFGMDNYLVDYEDVKDISFQITYFNGTENVTEPVPAEEVSYSNKIFVYVFDKYAAKDMDLVVKMDMLKDGEIYATTTYTTYAYVANNYAKTSDNNKGNATNTLADLCKAIGAYGWAASEYFN